MACLTIAPHSLNTLENDFNRVNAVLCSQIPGVVDVMQRLSPELRWTRRLIPDELGVLDRVLMKLRKGAWLFAIYMALHPENARQKRVNQAAWTAALGAWYLQPPARLTPFPVLVRAIAKHESDDVASNIQALEGISNRPDKLNRAYL
jgi:predicted RNA polymerase sigma factor